MAGRRHHRKGLPFLQFAIFLSIPADCGFASASSSCLAASVGIFLSWKDAVEDQSAGTTPLPTRADTAVPHGQNCICEGAQPRCVLRPSVWLWGYPTEASFFLDFVMIPKLRLTNLRENPIFSLIRCYGGR